MAAAFAGSGGTTNRMNDLQVLLAWFVPFAWVLTAAVLLLAGCLLFTSHLAPLRLARLLLFVAVAGLVSEAVLVTITTWAEFQHPTSSTGGLIVFVTVPMFIIAGIWAVVVVITAVMMGRHLREQ